jgi:aminoglycoside phosphotransferase (APT) family kinase protein
MTDVEEVRAGEDLDWEALDTYLRARLQNLSGGLTVLQFRGGTANLTYLLRFGPREFVLRRPPFGVIAPGAHDMAREYRVLSRLWRSYPRAPQAYLFCDDHTIIGADFFVMERRTGEVVRDAVPSSMTHHAEVGRRVGLAVVDAMADLHMLDPLACGLGELGRPEGFVARQVAGWRKRWELVRPDGAPPLMDQLPDRLVRTMPKTTRTAIVHNDLKLDNCQFDASSPDGVTSVFDWDMATLGDPMIDVGTLLNYWPDPSDPPDVRRAPHDGMNDIGLPSRAEVVERYAEQTGATVDGVEWYEAFAQWKTAVVVQQLYNRYLRRETRNELMAELGERMPVLAASAAAILDAASLPRREL